MNKQRIVEVILLITIISLVALFQLTDFPNSVLSLDLISKPILPNFQTTDKSRADEKKPPYIGTKEKTGNGINDTNKINLASFEQDSKSFDSASNIYVSLGSNANSDVMDALPLVVMSWLKLGIKSLLCLIGTEDVYKADKKLSLILSYLRKFDVTITFIPGPFVLNEITLAQIFTYNTLCCGFVTVKNSKVQHYPVTTIGMRVKTWKEILVYSKARYEDALSIEQALNKTLDSKYFDEKYFNLTKGKGIKHTNAWYADQAYISYHIFVWHKRKYDQIKMGSWAQIRIRIDRWKWPRKDQLEKLRIEMFNDAHLIRPLMPKWDDVRPLFVKIFSEDYMKIADEYANEYLKL
ncbi:unnamed protein product, partial [Mesorhabditis belari]|uniref:Uncharacterized protein n=1 Tax=Mesorhabditis belari TaxID=2138241 RepID=A0AAF3EGX4_9BILA